MYRESDTLFQELINWLSSQTVRQVLIRVTCRGF
jgi:hypothetical protein